MKIFFSSIPNKKDILKEKLFQCSSSSSSNKTAKCNFLIQSITISNVNSSYVPISISICHQSHMDPCTHSTGPETLPFSHSFSSINIIIANQLNGSIGSKRTP